MKIGLDLGGGQGGDKLGRGRGAASAENSSVLSTSTCPMWLAKPAASAMPTTWDRRRNRRDRHISGPGIDARAGRATATTASHHAAHTRHPSARQAGLLSISIRTHSIFDTAGEHAPRATGEQSAQRGARESTSAGNRTRASSAGSRETEEESAHGSAPANPQARSTRSKGHTAAEVNATGGTGTSRRGAEGERGDRPTCGGPRGGDAAGQALDTRDKASGENEPGTKSTR